MTIIAAIGSAVSPMAGLPPTGFPPSSVWATAFGSAWGRPPSGTAGTRCPIVAKVPAWNSSGCM